MKKKLMCLALATILLVMAVPAFAYRDSTFRASAIYRAYTFANFQKSTTANWVDVTPSSITYTNNTENKSYCMVRVNDDDGAQISIHGYTMVMDTGLGIGFKLKTSDSISSLDHYNLKVYNAYYYADSSDESHKMGIEATSYAYHAD